MYCIRSFLEVLYNTIVLYDADMAVCNFKSVKNNKFLLCSEYGTTSKVEVIEGNEKCLDAFFFRIDNYLGWPVGIKYIEIR